MTAQGEALASPEIGAIAAMSAGHHALGYGFGNLDAINPGGKNAARITGAFTGGEQASGVQAL